MAMKLEEHSRRVLGALMEKEMTTPDLYPLSINALLAACNQRSSRDPVLELDDDAVRTALDQLEALELVAQARDSGRVTRYEHRIRTVLNLRRDETALLCLLLLRGPQTPGELRSRSERLFAFDDLASVQASLDRLAGREDAIVAALPRAAGAREIRFTHLLGGAIALASEHGAGAARNSSQSSDPDELQQLRALVEALERRVLALEQA